MLNTDIADGRSHEQAYPPSGQAYPQTPGLNAQARPFTPQQQPAFHPAPGNYPPQHVAPPPWQQQRPGPNQWPHQQAPPQGYGPPPGLRPAYAQSNYAIRPPPQANGMFYAVPGLQVIAILEATYLQASVLTFMHSKQTNNYYLKEKFGQCYLC